MNISASAAAGGLYSFKSWYAGPLAPVRRVLVAADVPPAAITLAGIGCGASAGTALALLRPGPVAGTAVAVLLAARLGCANLDGGVARDGDRATPFGSVLNEVGDRAAELLALAGCLAFAPPALVLAAALAATLPSWVALAGGGGRAAPGPGRAGRQDRTVPADRVAGLLGFPRRFPRRAGGRLGADRGDPAGPSSGRCAMSGAAGMAAGLAGMLAIGGAGALASRNAEVIRTWRTWVVSAPLVAGFLWFGGPGAALLAAGLGAVGAVEYGRLARLRAADSWLVAAVAVALPLVAWRAPVLVGRVLVAALLAVALVPVLGGDAADGARRAAAGVFGTAWLAALTGLVLLRGAALPLIFAVSVADVGAWCAGRLGGGPALSPLSPAKRWTGAAGGALAGVAAGGAGRGGDPVTGAGRAAAARMAFWRAVLALTGGLRVHGTDGLPPGPCVIVANHSSHADTAALIAALPARRQPAVAAAADYWFRGGVRPAICQALCAAFPVRRSGGGSADLAAAARLLAAGQDVIVYPEGTRSRDGEIGDFHRGAARLAAAAGAPLVPAGISGTRTLLPPGGPGRPRRSAVTVRFGTPLFVTPPGGRSMIMDSSGRYVPQTAHDHERGPAVGEAMAEARARVVALVAGTEPRAVTAAAVRW